MYIYIYKYFPGNSGHVAFIGSNLNYMLPVRPSCFNQVFLDSSGRRTYDVTSARIMGRMVQGEYKCKELCIVWRGGDNAQSFTIGKRIFNSKSRTGNLPKGATLQIMVNIIS